MHILKGPDMIRTGLFVTAIGGILMCTTALASPQGDVLTTYSNIAEAAYGDSLTTAKALQASIAALIAAPSDGTLNAARQAWLDARVPYLQTEVFRFGNPIVDDWEGKVNAWPLDEGLIDYVDTSYGGTSDENAFRTLNVIATPQFTLNDTEIDATTITPALLSDSLQEADEIEANVATGYHAVEFLLWGQDLNGTGPGAGARAYTDYVQGTDCTNGNCDRRAQYLQAAADLLVTDLADMTDQWAPDGGARASLMADENAGLSAILTGMGSLSYGELAGERIKLGLLLNDPEEEQDCFSDNTHNSHYYDGLGIRNVYLGSYTRSDGTSVSGPSLSALVAAADPALDTQLNGELDASVAALAALKAKAEAGMAYDQMLDAANPEGNAIITSVVDALVTQTKSIEAVVTALNLGGVTIEGSDSLDNTDAVFQ
jgi:putative iron-regulated protein